MRSFAFLQRWPAAGLLARCGGDMGHEEDHLAHYIQGASGRFFLRRKSGLKSLDW
jgi:hypothetical protein